MIIQAKFPKKLINEHVNINVKLCLIFWNRFNLGDIKLVVNCRYNKIKDITKLTIKDSWGIKMDIK